jgi:hypothetical protein
MLISRTRDRKEITIIKSNMWKGPVIKTKWSHMPIAFTAIDINLACFPHTDAMVISVHIDRWDVTRILVDNGSQAEVLFLSAFEQMSYNRR